MQMIFCIKWLRTWKMDLIIKHLVKDKGSSWFTDSLNRCMLAGTPHWNLYFIFPTSSNLNRNGLMIVILPNHKKLKWRMSWNSFQVYISVILCKGKEWDFSTFFSVVVFFKSWVSTGCWVEGKEEENVLDLLLGPNSQCLMKILSLGYRSSCDKLKEVHQREKQESVGVLFLSTNFTIPAFLNPAATLTSVIPLFSLVLMISFLKAYLSVYSWLKYCSSFFSSLNNIGMPEENTV